MAVNGILAVLGVLCALAGTILLYIFVLPENKKENLPKFFKVLHEIFNFKSLLIEKILKVFYTFSTLICIFCGFFMIFSFQVYTDWYGDQVVRYNGWVGFLLMILGPIVVRLLYESLMMFILLVKNTIQINNKLKDQNNNPQNEEEFTSSINM